MKKEIIGFATLIIWLGIVVAFAVNFNLQERLKIDLFDLFTLRSPMHLFIALAIVALIFSLLLKILVAASRKSATAKTISFALLILTALSLFGLFAKLAVDYRHIFSVGRLTNGIIAVLTFTGGLMWIAVARLFELATSTGGSVKRKK